MQLLNKRSLGFVLLVAMIAAALWLLVLCSPDVRPQGESAPDEASPVSPAPAMGRVDSGRELVTAAAESGGREVAPGGAEQTSSTLTVEVRDDAGLPVAGCRVHPRKSWPNLQQLEASDHAFVTGETGMVDIDGLSAGKWFLLCLHDRLVQDISDRPQPVVHLPEDRRCRIVLHAPVFAGIQTKGLDVVAFHVETSGRGLASPDGAHANQAVDRMRLDLERRWPGSHMAGYVTDVSARTDTPTTCEGVVYPAGRYPVRVTLHPVPIDQFVGPVVIDASMSLATAEFGSAMVTIRNGDEVLDDREFWLYRRDRRTGDPDPFRGLMKQCRSGQLLTLPAGEYRVDIPGLAWLSAVAKQEGDLEVSTGGFTERNIGAALQKVIFAMTAEDGSTLTGASFSLRNPAMQIKITELLDDRAEHAVRWLPVGSYLYSASAFTTAGATLRSTGMIDIVPGDNRIEIVVYE